MKRLVPLIALFLLPAIAPSNVRASIPVSNTVFVDAVLGSDASGARGFQDMPFQTLQAAWTAAQPGDIIEMRPSSPRTINDGSTAPAADCYVVSSLINLGGKSHITIHGNGAWIVTDQPDTERIFSIYGGADFLTVENLNVDARRTNTGPGSNGAVELYGPLTDIRFSHCQVINSRSPAWRPVGAVDNLTLSDCVSDTCFQGVAVVLGLGYAPTNSTFENCRFVHCTIPGQGGGVRFNRGGNPGAIDLKGTKIVHCQIETAGLMGIEMWSGAATTGGFTNYTVDGNYVRDCVFGISIDCAQQASVVNNRVKACTYIGIETGSGSDGVVVSNNIVDGRDDNGNQVGANGITCTNLACQNMVFSHNVVRECSTLMFLQDAENPLVESNQFIKNTAGEAVHIQNGNGYILRNNVFTGSVDGILSVDNSNSRGQHIDNIIIEGNQVLATARSYWFGFGAYNNHQYHRVRLIGNNVPNAGSEGVLTTAWLAPGSQAYDFAMANNTTGNGTEINSVGRVIFSPTAAVGSANILVKSGSIAGVTRLGVGNYRIIFTDPIGGYVPSVLASNDGVSQKTVSYPGGVGALTSGYFDIQLSDPSGAAADASVVTVSVQHP